MKLFWLFLLLGALGCQAAVQYDYGSISGAKNDLNNPDFAAAVDRGNWGGGLQNTMYFNQKAYLYASFSKGESAAFGAYYVDGKNKGQEIKLVETADGRLTAVDAKGKPIQFQPGDSVGFWITDANGKIVYNTPGLDGQHTFNGTAILNGNEYVIGFGNYGDYIGSGDYDEMIKDSSFVMNVQVGSTAPSGQPLPGVVACLILGGSIYGGKRLLKKRAGRSEERE